MAEFRINQVAKWIDYITLNVFEASNRQVWILIYFFVTSGCTFLVLMNSLDPTYIEFHKFWKFREVSIYKFMSKPDDVSFFVDNIPIWVYQISPSIDFSTSHIQKAISIKVLLLYCIAGVRISF